MPVLEMPVGSIERPLRIRRRRDLEACAQSVRGAAVWAIKDPVALKYFHLQDEAHWVLEQLDGRTSAAEIQSRYARRFAPKRLALAQLRAVLSRLHDDGLVVVDSPGQAEQLQLTTWLRARQ